MQKEPAESTTYIAQTLRAVNLQRFQARVLGPYVFAFAQFIALIIWSAIKWHDYSLTWDFAVYDQAAFLIAHGQLNPFSSVLGFSFLNNDVELIMWPIALVLLVFKSGLALLITQDLSLAITSLITILWVKDVVLAQQSLSLRIQSYLILLGCVLAVASPWIYWASSFDFHVEPIILPFVVLTGKAFWNNTSRKGYIWAGIVLLGGNVAATFLAGIGLMQILRGRRYVKSGVLLIGISLVALFLIERVVPGGIKGGNLSEVYGYLLPRGSSDVSVFSLALGALHHPMRISQVLWASRWNIYGEIAPSGVIGLFTPIGMGVPLVTLLTDNLMFINGHVTFFGTPTYFQGITAIPFVVVGTIFLLAWFLSKIHNNIIVIAVFLVVTLNAVIWCTVWIPPIESNLINVSSKAARTLALVNSNVSPNTEVISTQAFMGRFADRQWITGFLGNDGTPIAVHARTVLFLVSPYEGIEHSAEIYELSRIEALTKLRGSHLVGHGGGIWAFAWVPPHGVTNVTLSTHSVWMPAWALHHPVGIPILSGPVQDWHIATASREGYLIDGFYKRISPGDYLAKFRVSSTIPALMEIWNATGNILLAQYEIPSTNGMKQQISVPFDYRRGFSTHIFRGIGVWRINPPPPPHNDQIELRVWTTGRGVTDIYGVNIVSR